MNVLLVEDETHVADFIARGLKAEGWVVEHAPDGETALEKLVDAPFDVVVLDLMLPGMSGQDVCRKLRARRNIVPVLMLTALDATDERVAGLRLGADDYLAKPFDFDELVARIEALARRAARFDSGLADPALVNGALRFDRRSLIVTAGDRTIELTAKERDILQLLMSNPDRVLARERILNAVWGSQEEPLTNVVDVYVGRLRKKLGDCGSMIETVRGLGYRLGRREPGRRPHVVGGPDDVEGGIE